MTENPILYLISICIYQILLHLRKWFIIKRMTYKGFHHFYFDSVFTILCFILSIFLIGKDEIWIIMISFIWSLVLMSENIFDLVKIYTALKNDEQLMWNFSKVMAYLSEEKMAMFLIYPAIAKCMERRRKLKRLNENTGGF